MTFVRSLDDELRKAAINEDIEAASKEFRRRNFLNHRKAAAKWMDELHEFVLVRGDDNTGRRKTMTGREAKILNAKMEEQFAKRVLDEPQRRLWRWCVADRRERVDERKARINKVLGRMR